MRNLENALAEVKYVEDFMRRRYLYEHPIFAHITAAVTLLEGEVALRPPPPPEETIVELKAEAEELVEIEAEPKTEEGEEIEKPEGFTQASRRARR